MAGELRTVTGLKYFLMVRTKIPYNMKSFNLCCTSVEQEEKSGSI